MKPGTAKAFFVAIVLIGSLLSCKDRCYECHLMQINGPDAVAYPNDTIAIDTVITCDRKWVKENNVPDDEMYPQSWRCKQTN